MACCSVLQCVVVCCSVVQCVAMCCSVLQCVVVGFMWRNCAHHCHCYRDNWSLLQCVAVC